MWVMSISGILLRISIRLNKKERKKESWLFFFLFAYHKETSGASTPAFPYPFFLLRSVGRSAGWSGVGARRRRERIEVERREGDAPRAPKESHFVPVVFLGELCGDNGEKTEEWSALINNSAATAKQLMHRCPSPAPPLPQPPSPPPPPPPPPSPLPPRCRRRHHRSARIKCGGQTLLTSH